MAVTIPHNFNIVRFQRPELIPDIEKFLTVSIFKMATTIPQKFNIAYDLLLYCFLAAFLVKRSTTHTNTGSLKCSLRRGSHTNSILMQITEVSQGFAESVWDPLRLTDYYY
jgi:hypothetical protein